MRLLASLHHYLATVTDDGIQLNQYASSRIRAGDVVLSVETAYPWDGTVRVEVVESPDREWTLALRIPGWAREATLVCTLSDLGRVPARISVEDLAFAEDLVPPGVPKAPHNPDPPRYSGTARAWLAVCVNSGTAEAEFKLSLPR